MKCSGFIFFISVLLLIVSNEKSSVSSGSGVGTAPHAPTTALQPNEKETTAVNHDHANEIDPQVLISDLLGETVGNSPVGEKKLNITDKYEMLLGICCGDPIKL